MTYYIGQGALWLGQDTNGQYLFEYKRDIKPVTVHSYVDGLKLLRYAFPNLKLMPSKKEEKVYVVDDKCVDFFASIKFVELIYEG